MSAVAFNKQQFLKLLGKNLSDKDIEEKVSNIGIGVEKIDSKEIILDVFPNRPDMLGEYGLTRALKTFIGIDKGMRKYRVNKSNYKLFVNKNVKNIRPYAACAVVKNLKINEEKLKQIIQLQEKLHLTYCRGRKKAAIGVYPLDRISFPVNYSAMKPNEILFRPLDSGMEMSAEEILEKHPKGKQYGHLIDGKKFYPVWTDNKNNVMSLAPIINSHLTGKLDENTKDVFIECTGNDYKALSKCINIMSAELADSGGELYEVEISMYGKKLASPKMMEEEIELDAEYINNKLGLNIKEKEIANLLSRMGHGTKKKREKIIALVPPYRTDVLHAIDIVEDIAIAYGYDKFSEEMPKIVTIAEENGFEIFKNKVCNILTTLGFQECNTYNLDSIENQAEKMNLDSKKWNFVELANALNEDYKILREWITPSLMKVLAENKHNEYPQNIFCTGRCFRRDENSETKVKEFVRLGILLCNSNSNFTHAKQVMQSLLDSLNVKYDINETEHTSFITGRVARMSAKGENIAYLGEIHPKVLENYNLEMPVAALEINLTELFKIIKEK